MKPTPSALKWLAETRARVAHHLAESERVQVALRARTDKLREELAALDRTMTIYDPTIWPADVQPVNGHRPNYGQRGGLTAAIARILKAQAPHYVSTELLLVLLCAEFGLKFETPQELSRWRKNVVARRLRHMLGQGLVEREQDPSAWTVEFGRWCWKQSAAVATLADL
ncbi:MAG: hypothetical protein KGL99_05790 [Burkholderiales bacterium]|nr:hypothetical protein [Burkholderiales bacterium]MDE2300214.1 hypothetical protein [Burkholderiales bacterium]MDE2626648.1 hypothetical protein [Burkholderiales bacterium]